MGLDELTPVVEAHEVACRLGPQVLADEARRQGVERLGDLGELVAPTLGSHQSGMS